MAYFHYDRLTALDAAFLEIEDENVHMHVGSVGIFEAGPLTTPSNELDIDRIRASSEASLRRSPRFRQRLAYVPMLGHPVWVDDERFNLSYHLRHTSLPRPGGMRLLKRLTGRIMSQKLDRGKPLWEMWFVEGVEPDKFAVITKVHHCMIDGIAGIDLMSSLMRADRDHTVEHASPWIPRPAPTPARLLADDLYRRGTLPLHVVRAGGVALTHPVQQVKAARDAITGLGEALLAGISSASPTPLNPAIGPHRRFDWTRLDLEAVKEIKNRLGGTLNDVVLAIVAGAIRRFLRGRGVDLAEIDFRAMVPVNVRAESQRGSLGNRVSILLARLPLDEGDARQRLNRVIETTKQLKSSKQALGAEVLEEISDWTLSSLFVQYARLGARSRAYNMVVTNIPGPQMPVYLLGCRMLEPYPLVPLYTNQALGVALFSYDGGLFWGFNADWDAIPDLHDVVGAVEKEFHLLRKIAAEAPAAA